MTSKEIAELAKMMQRLGIVSIKTSEIEMLVQPKPVTPRRRRMKSVEFDEVDPKLDNSFKGYSEDELLGWSSMENK